MQDQSKNQLSQRNRVPTAVLPLRPPGRRRRCVLLVGVVFCFTALSDTIVRSDGTRIEGVRVVALEGADIVTEPARRLPLSGVRLVEFSAFAVPAKPTRLLLTDGTILYGLLRRLQGPAVQFRSCTFGLLEIPAEHVAGIAFTDTGLTAETCLAPADGMCSLRQRDGGLLTGQLMWVDMSSIGLLTGGELKTVSTPDVLHIGLRASPARVQGIVLRNGDRFARFAPAAERTELALQFAGESRTVPLRAVMRLFAAGWISAPLTIPAAAAEAGVETRDQQ